MTDYSLMTDDEIDIEIARRRGWTIVRYPEDDIDTEGQEYPPYLGWKVLDGDGKPLGRMLAFEDPGPWKNFHYFIQEARVAADLNAAAELLKDMDCGGLSRDDEIDAWNVSAFVDGFGIVADAQHEHPARAVCLSYLLYTDLLRTPAMPVASRGGVSSADDGDDGARG